MTVSNELCFKIILKWKSGGLCSKNGFASEFLFTWTELYNLSVLSKIKGKELD